MDTTITLYKLKDSLEPEDQGLRATVDGKYTYIEVQSIPGVDIQLMVKFAAPNPPPWQDVLRTISSDRKLQNIQNTTMGALLLVRRGPYRFIIAYGTGRHSIAPEAIEQNFGLRVAASVVPPDRVKAAFTKRLGPGGRTYYVSMPEAGPLYQLGIEPTEDLVRQLEGQPPAIFAKGVSGGDTLRLSVKDL